jgi:hypothetical protein
MTDLYLVTTVNIVAPVRLQEHVGRLHRAHRPDRLMKVPAHFTVLHPFVGYRELDEGLARLRQVCAGLPPAEIVVEGYGAFPGVVYLAARDPEPIRAISRALCAEFPECPLYEGEFGPELSPHVTAFETEEDAPSLARGAFHRARTARVLRERRDRALADRGHHPPGRLTCCASSAARRPTT